MGDFIVIIRDDALKIKRKGIALTRIILNKKSILYNTIYYLMLGALSLSCATFQDAGKNANGLSYSSMLCANNNSLQAAVVKGSGGEVLFFQVVDKIDDKETINSYTRADQRFKDYPAFIEENRLITVLVNNRFEIRLYAEKESEEFQNTEKLRWFLSMFNFWEIERCTITRPSCGDLRNFAPPLALPRLRQGG